MCSLIGTNVLPNRSRSFFTARDLVLDAVSEAVIFPLRLSLCVPMINIYVSRNRDGQSHKPLSHKTALMCSGPEASKKCTMNNVQLLAINVEKVYPESVMCSY